MDKEDMIEAIETQLSMLEEAFDEYERIWGMGDFDVAMANYGFITASLNYTRDKFIKICENWELDGLAPMLVRHLEYHLRYIKIGKEIVNKFDEVVEYE